MGRSNQVTGLIQYVPEKAYRGYTLFSANGGDDAYLVDMDGCIVHQWHSDAGISYGNLLANGNLLFRDRGEYRGMPGSGSVQEMTFDGEVVWEYRNPLIRRHSRLPNGNTLLLLYEEISQELTQQVQGGFVSPNDPERMLGDLVVEVAPDGSTVYEWRSSDHLNTSEDVICPLENRALWGGANDLTALDGGHFLISFRILNTVALVNRQTGEFSWKWGAGQISHQHHPTLLSNGHVLLLDNGAHRRGLSYSRVIEVDPGTSEIVWEHHGEPLMSFFTHFTGGAQRLPNGNTLITEGLSGRLFEVTATNHVVWEYVSPFLAYGTQGLANGVFRAHRYGPEDPALAGKDLDPARYSNLNRLFGRTS